MSFLDSYLMKLFQFVLLFLQFKCEITNRRRDSLMNVQVDEFVCNQMDTAYLTLESNSPVSLDLFYQYVICETCDLLKLTSIESNAQSKLTLNSYFSYKFQVSTQNNETICDTFVFDEFGECGSYLLQVDYFEKMCSIQTVRKPQNSNYYLFVALAILLVFMLTCNLAETYKNRIQILLSKLNLIEKQKIRVESQPEEMRTTSSNQAQNLVKEVKREEKQRFRSLDTFRGITIFLMIFVNYGSGGFKFMQHVPWNGITIADFVFPWFLWIMGFSIPLATNSLFKKATQKSRWAPFKKIFIRSLKMFLLGLILNSRFGVELGKLRIFGVLQRLAICYFIVATLELFLYKNIGEQSASKSWSYYFNDLIWAKFHFLIMALILTCWWLVTYLVEVPGCPRGYMGPGGLDLNSLYFNCTGGINYIELDTNGAFYNLIECIVFKELPVGSTD